MSLPPSPFHDTPLAEFARSLRSGEQSAYGAARELLARIEATDHKLRAFDSHTGKLLWEADLPYAGTATPATYQVDGKQYVVIEANNARNRDAPQGAAYVAFSLK